MQGFFDDLACGHIGSVFAKSPCGGQCVGTTGSDRKDRIVWFDDIAGAADQQHAIL